MYPILENEAQGSGIENVVKKDRTRHKNTRKKNSLQSSQNGQCETVVGERRKFLVTKLPADEAAVSPVRVRNNNAHTIHFGSSAAEPQRPSVRDIFDEKKGDLVRSNSFKVTAAKDDTQYKYQTIHGTSVSQQRPSIFDLFRPKRKSDGKRPSLIQNIKSTFSKNSNQPSKSSEPKSETLPKTDNESASSDKRYYHTVTGASSRRSSPITKVMDIFRSKPSHDTNLELDKKKGHAAAGQVIPSKRRSSLGAVNTYYNKGSYASLDPLQARQAFREVRGLPKYDPYLSIVQISIGGRDKSRLLINFFKYHKCYEILPKSAKVIVFDTQFLVRKAFTTLISNGIRSAPLWNSDKKSLVGMITVTDFIMILKILYENQKSMDELEEHTLSTWRVLLKEHTKPLCFVSPNASLLDAINILINNHIHRIPIVDEVTGDVLHILSQKRVLRFLFVYLSEFPEIQFIRSKLQDLNIGTYDNIETVSESTSVLEAFEKFNAKCVSALPLVDENGVLIDVYAKHDVINLVAEKTYNNLKISLKEACSRKKVWMEKLQKCNKNITLYEALEIIVRSDSHRIFIVNEDNTLFGIVTLTDLLKHLISSIPNANRNVQLDQLFTQPSGEGHHEITESPTHEPKADDSADQQVVAEDMETGNEAQDLIDNSINSNDCEVDMGVDVEAPDNPVNASENAEIMTNA